MIRHKPVDWQYPPKADKRPQRPCPAGASRRSIAVETQAHEAWPMNFVVKLSPFAVADLERLFDFLLEQADTTEDLDRAQAAFDAIRATTQHRLAITPLSFRKAAQYPAQRELIIPFGGTGYVALHEIVNPSKVVVLAVRFQREEDYH
jgi:plasmid stabilization system protein ParE